jgi:hypothetical protein
MAAVATDQAVSFRPGRSGQIPIDCASPQGPGRAALSAMAWTGEGRNRPIRAGISGRTCGSTKRQDGAMRQLSRLAAGKMLIVLAFCSGTPHMPATHRPE